MAHSVDPVTGLFNYSGIFGDLHEIVSAGRECPPAVALVIVDLDHFRLVNFAMGYSVGDEVLRDVAVTLRRVLPPNSIGYHAATRFCFLVPKYARTDAAALAERFRSEIEGTSFGEKKVRLTASFGIACIPRNAPTGEALLRSAHRALKKAKRAGGNCVVVAGGFVPEDRARRWDDLTGLRSGRTLDSRLPLAVRRSLSSNRPLAVVMADIDRFKEVNDRFGHYIGDTVISTVGVTMSLCARNEDKVYRLYGDNFVLLLPDLTAKEAAVVAERARRELEEMKSSLGHFPALASFGVASCPAHASDAPALLECSEIALYQAKFEGGNCVRIFRPPEGEPDGGASVCVRRRPPLRPKGLHFSQRE